MAISYEVGAIFQVRDEATPSLRRISSELKAINEQIERTKVQLSYLGANAFTGFTSRVASAGEKLRELGRVADSTAKQVVGVGEAGVKAADEIDTSFNLARDTMKLLGASAVTAATTIGDAFKGVTASVTAALDEVRALQEQLARTAKASAALGTSAGGGAGAAAVGAVGGGALRARGRHGGPHLHGHLPSPIHGVRMTGGGDGMVPAAIGGFTLYELVKGGFETQHWLSQMSAQGATEAEMKAAYNAAVEQAQANVNTNIPENLKTIIEAKKALGDWGEAGRLMPAMSVANVAMRSVKASDLHARFNSDGQALGFSRALEEMGVPRKGATPEEREGNLRSYAAEMIRTMIGLRGTVDGNEFFNLTNNSGGAAMNWDKEFATSIAPIIGAEIKAGKLGNADYMMLRGLQQGKLPLDTVEQMRGFDIDGKHIKLLGDDDVRQDSAGKWHLKPNSKFAEGMDRNPWRWSAGLLENLQAQGLDIFNQEQMNKVVNVIGSNKSLAMLLRNLLEPQARGLIQKDIDARNRVPTDAAGILMTQDPLLRMDALKNKLTDFFAVLGGPLTDTAIDAIGHMTDALRQMNSVLEEHPTLQKGAGYGLAALAGGALVNGVGKLLGVGSWFGGGGAAAGGAAAGGAAAASGGILSRLMPWLFGGTAAAVTLPLALSGDTRRGDPTADDIARAKAAEEAYAKAHGGYWLGGGGGGGSTAPSAETLRALDRARSNINPAFRDDPEQLREHNRARDLSKLPAPNVQVHTDVSLQNNVKVMIDGKEIAATIEASIVKKFEHSTTAPTSDSHGMFAGPDMSTMAV